jgi:hypothetical protein
MKKFLDIKGVPNFRTHFLFLNSQFAQLKGIMLNFLKVEVKSQNYVCFPKTMGKSKL